MSEVRDATSPSPELFQPTVETSKTTGRGKRKTESLANKAEVMWRYECAVAAQGFMRVAGVDEAGRGPLAGPIVAGAVVLNEPVQGLDDSKLLDETERERLYEVLITGGHAVGWAIVTAAEIDQMGIQRANYQVMINAAGQLQPAPDFLLVDGFSIPGCAIPHQRIVKGDRLSQSIAAASIVAKVTRDRIMCELDAQFPEYGFARHKGYATQEHLDAIKRSGPCLEHRLCFAPLARNKVQSTFAFGSTDAD